MLSQKESRFGFLRRHPFFMSSGSFVQFGSDRLPAVQGRKLNQFIELIGIAVDQPLLTGIRINDMSFSVTP